MSETKRIKTALVSVYHKEGLDEIITKLHEEGVEFLSTGGTRQFIESLGYPCKAVEAVSYTHLTLPTKTLPHILPFWVDALRLCIRRYSEVFFAAADWNKTCNR